MDLAAGAMNTLLPKLAELVFGEYKLQKGVKGEIKELEEELTSMTAALRRVAELPPDQLDEQVKIWAGDVRELSYDIEDEVDTFMLHDKGHEHTRPFSLKGLIDRATDLYKWAKTNHQIHNAIKDIMHQVKMANERRKRYKVDSIAARPAMVAVDPRLEGMYRKAAELVGISQPKNELAKRLLEHDCSSSSRHQSNLISIVGCGGLGKTTLANSLLQDLKAKFDCHVFVSVSLNPDIMMIFKNILLQLHDKKCVSKDEPWEMKQLIDRIIELLKDRRCLCVIYDLWKESAWDTIKLAFQDGHPRSKMIITTRYKSVAEHVGGGVYELKPLSPDDSGELLTKRIFGTNDDCPSSLREVTGKILKKCGGVPLAIITTASLLACKPRCLEEWEKVNKSFGSGRVGDSLDVDKMRKILSLSYNDLPFHLKTCLLSLSKYPEDQLIRKDVVVWSWIGEGFIKQEDTQGPAGKSLQEIAESYINDLINRSLILPATSRKIEQDDGQVHYCQVHDMVLELINQLLAESDMQKRNTRRLSLHNNSNGSYTASPEASREQLSKVRSLDIFGKFSSLPPLSSFGVLRVLQVVNCSRFDIHHLNDLGKLRLLRFLQLHDLKVTELPESIGELESLETLDIRRQEFPWTRLMVLPISFAKLRRLVRLLGTKVGLPYGLTLENMIFLRELRGISATLHARTEIAKVEELKVLELRIPWLPPGILPSNTSEWIAKFLQSFPSLQVFILWSPPSLGPYLPVDLMAWLPSSLRTFSIIGGGFFNKAFPKWTKPQLSHLTILHLRLLDMRVLPEHLEQLAELPSLCFLHIYSVRHPNVQKKLSTTSGFPCLTHLYLSIPLFFIMFQQGAMPKLQKLHLLFDPIATIKHIIQNSTFYCGLDNLPSLRHVSIQLMQNCAEAEVAIRKAVNDHPNHPSLDLSYGRFPYY